MVIVMHAVIFVMIVAVTLRFESERQFKFNEDVIESEH